MARGGAREGSGRPKGSKTAKTSQIALEAAGEGLTPLEWMLRVLRDDEQPNDRRDDMAKAAAPYIHPRLATNQVVGDPDKPLHHIIEQRIVDPEG